MEIPVIAATWLCFVATHLEIVSTYMLEDFTTYGTHFIRSKLKEV